MKTIHIFSPGFTNPNSCAFLFPFYVFKRALSDAGFKVRVFTKITGKISACDVLMIEHKAMSKTWDDMKSTEILQMFRETTKVIWCDQSDSTGTFFGQVLPHVDRYLKAQKLKDTVLYKCQYYGDRIYTDYYHQAHNVIDDVHYDYQPATGDEDIDKIGVSWNSSLMNHGYWGPYLGRVLEHTPSRFITKFCGVIARPEIQRSVDLTCRMGISYPRATARFQRERMRELLVDYMSSEKLSRGQYFRELADSKICASAFGYGEITLKDFEAFLTGVALLKPDMDHLETWPPLYQKDKTYIAHDWDLDDLKDTIELYLKEDQKRIEIARQGQELFIRHTVSKDAAALFVQHFSGITRF